MIHLLRIPSRLFLIPLFMLGLSLAAGPLSVKSNSGEIVKSKSAVPIKKQVVQNQRLINTEFRREMAKTFQRFHEAEKLNGTVRQQPTEPQRIPQAPSLRIGMNSAGQQRMPAGQHHQSGHNTGDSMSMPEDLINVTINGVENAVIFQGEPFTVNIAFSTGASEAWLSMWLDADGNAELDSTVDIDVEDPFLIVDNDDSDEDPAVGYYQFSPGANDGPNSVSNLSVLILAEDSGGSDVASLFVAPVVTSYSVSGMVEPAIANLFILAFPSNGGPDSGDPYLTVSNPAGSYQNYLPDPGPWHIMAMDFFGLLDGMIADTMYWEVNVSGNLTGFDFPFVMPNSGVQGHVSDEFGAPLPDLGVYAHGEGPGFETSTDETGYYMLNVTEGDYWVGIYAEDLIPEYLVPHDSMLYVMDNDTLTRDFTAYTATALIEGTVFLDGSPLGDIGVRCGSPLGWTKTRTGPDGHYIQHVSPAADEQGGYHLGINWHNLPPNIIAENIPNHVQSGTMDANIYLITVNGGLEGVVHDNSTGDPLPYAWVWADGNNGGNGTGTDENGHYYLPLLGGEYTVHAGADGYFQQMVQNIVIQDGVLQLDFWLDPVTINGMVFGYVTDAGTSLGIEGAEVSAGSDIYWDNAWTDASGYYEIPLPNGYYGMMVQKEGYSQAYSDNLIIADNAVQRDFQIQEIVINSAITGIVIDQVSGQPVIGADVMAVGNLFEAWAQTTTGGNFFMAVPSDTFTIWSHAPGFGHSQSMQIFVPANDTIEVVLELFQPVMVPPQIMAVVDVPNDQGRQVHLVWNPGGTPMGDVPWTEFSVWRLVPQAPFPLWDYIATVPFHGPDPYAMVAPTLVDSNQVTGPTGMYWSTFMVTAHTFNPWEFYNSNPADGYSIDNLHPAVPGNLLAAVIPGNNQVELTWTPVPDEDFAYYTIYRATTPGVPLAEPLGMTIDTVFIDQTVAVGGQYYYVVTATDFNGNESDASGEANVELLNLVELSGIPERFALKQNFPNPFNPRTQIEYDLAEDGPVSLVVYNLLGVEVYRMVQSVQPAGRYSVTWNAGDLPSGIYILRLQAGKFSESRKMMLLK